MDPQLGYGLLALLLVAVGGTAVYLYRNTRHRRNERRARRDDRAYDRAMDDDA